VNRIGQMFAGTLVVVVTTVIVTFVPSQLSTAAGGVNTSGAPHSTVKLVPQVNTGGVVSTTVIVWLQVDVFVHRSAALQVRVTVKRIGQMFAGTFVVVVTSVMVTLVPSQASAAAGGVNTSGAPHSSVKLVPQLNTGGVVSTTVIVWLQVEVFVHRSAALQVRVTVKRIGQMLAGTLVVVVRMVIVTFVPSHASTAAGGVKTSVSPHSTVKFVPQVKTGGVVSTKVNVWLQVLALVQKSTARQVRVTVKRVGQIFAGTLVIVPTTVTVTLVPSQLSSAVG
jgi:hypothetical protein